LIYQFGGSRDGFVGVGITFEPDQKEGVLITKVFEESPAARSGIKVGDVLLEVDSQKTLYKTKEDILSLLKGNEGDSVVLKILHSTGEVINIKVSREKIKVSPPTPIPYASIAISPDGNTLASGTDNTIKLWDKKGNLLKEISEHKGIVTKLRFSRDGKFLVSGGRGKSVKLWTVDGNAVATIDDNCFGVNDINFTLDSKSLVVACQNSVVRLWNLDGILLKPLLGKFVSQEQAFGEVGAFIGRKIISSDLQPTFRS
jgi:WD40 repeat protein